MNDAVGRGDVGSNDVRHVSGIIGEDTSSLSEETILAPNQRVQLVGGYNVRFQESPLDHVVGKDSGQGFSIDEIWTQVRRPAPANVPRDRVLESG